jgi:hypothetical protein
MELIRLWTIRKLGDNSKLFGHPKEVYVCLYLIMMRVIKCSMHALIAFQTLLLYLLTGTRTKGVGRRFIAKVS